MKKRWVREIGLLSLPVLLIVGAASWKAGASNWWHETSRSHIKVVKTFVLLKPPVDVAEEAGESDTEVVLSVDEQIPFWLRGPQYIPQLVKPNHNGGALRSFGRKSGATIGTNLSYGRGFAMDGSLIPAQLATPTQFHVSLQTQRAAKSVGEIRLNGTFAAQNLPDTPFTVVVRPAWYTRTAKQLRVTDVQWHPARKGSGGTVEVGLIYSGKKPLIMRGATASGWKPRYMNLSAGYRQSAANRDEIVAHWSQHIESGDGQYNSLNELEYAEVDLYTTAKIGQSIDTKALADKFEPRVLPQNYKITGNRVRVMFKVTSLPKTIKNPVFKAEIGLANDGFVGVSCWLPAK